MRRTPLLFMILALLGAGSTPARAQEKVKLQFRAKAGQVMRYKAEGTLTLEAAGNKLTIELKQTEKVTVTEVAASGEVTIESVTESYEMSINGQKLPSEDRETKATITVRPDRTLVRYTKESSEEDSSKLSVRLFCATSPVFPADPVGVGDKWSHTYVEDATLGTRAARADFELQALEKYAGHDAAKIRMVFKESQGSPALGATVTAWVELSTGDTLASETEVENVPFGDDTMAAYASGKVSEQRTEGNPLGEAAAQTPASGEEKKPETKPEQKPEPKKEKTIDEVVKDFDKQEGILTVYRKKESGRDTIYLEIPEAKLDRLFMLQVTASTGTPDRLPAGMPINDLVFKFSRVDERIMLVVPNYRFRAKEGSPIERAVRRSFADAYLEAFRIEAKQPDRNSILINVSDFFRGDVAQISQAFSGGSPIPGLGGGGASYSMDRDKTFVDTIKVFPENMVVTSQYHFTRGASSRSVAGLLAEADSPLVDPRSIPVRVVYTLFQLKETGYKPRLADPRVGYFYTEYQDFTRDNLEDVAVRYIYRWNLEKADPGAKVSPPKKPIVFWLDNAIPVEYRDAVRQGILDWNAAFLAAGIRDAIEVKQMPDDADWDHADMRYNVIRWVTSPSDGYAMALFRVNPLTGEILSASITVDANIVRFNKIERRRLVEPASFFQDPEPHPLGRHGLHACTYAEQAMQQAWLGHLILTYTLPQAYVPDELTYTRAFLRNIVTHEMGHILGLRHNFVASTAFSLSQLKVPAFVQKEGVTASVMDYTPFNIAAIKQKGVPFWASRVGRYDKWCIEYGYSAPPPNAGSESAYLKKIASRNTQPGLAYQSDELADQFDPDVTRFDLGADPLAYWARNLQIVRYLMLNLDKRSPRPGESYWVFTRQLNMLVALYAQAAASAARYVGGVKIRGNFRGDPGEKPVLEPVPAAKQREALRLLNTYIFAPNAFNLPRSYYGKLAGNPFPDLIRSVLSGSSADFPMLDTFASIQSAALRRIFSPAVMRRVLNNEFRRPDNGPVLTLAEIFRSVGYQVWSDIGSGKPVSPLRRQLQRAHLELMIGMVVQPAPGTPEDARMLAWDQLRTLKTRLQSARTAAASDPYTRVHVEESLMRIQRALDARQMIGGSAPGAPSLLQMLLGGRAQP